MTKSKGIKVLVVDDSALMRKLLTKMLSVAEDIEVVGTAMDGSFALQKVEALRPDVVTLDLVPRKKHGGQRLNHPHFGVMYDFLQLEVEFLRV